MIIPYGFLKQPDSGIVPLYDNVSVFYTLRRPPMTVLWTNAVRKIRRLSDNQTAFLFIDGNNIGDTISLNSKISTTSNTTPSATTLFTFSVGSSCFVEEWIGITPNNIIDNNKIATQTTINTQPRIKTGVILEDKNGKPIDNFLTDTRFLTAPPNTDLDTGKTFTILTVSFSDSTSDLQSVLSTKNTIGGISERLIVFNDRTSGKEINRIRNNSGVNVKSIYGVQQDNNNQRLLTTIVTPTNLKGYLGTSLEDSNSWTGTYINNALQIGAQLGTSTPLNGGINEIIIFPSDKTSDLTALHNDIINYYSIP